MTTVFPGSVDALPRPSAGTKTNAAGGLNLSSVIDNLSDAVEAIETYTLLPDPLTTNGNLSHWQRAAGSAVTSTTTYNTMTSYAADAVFVLPAGASLTQQRSTTVPNVNSRYSLQLTGAASVTTVDIGQRIAAAVVATRGLRSLVFSAYVFNGSGGSFTPNLRIGTPAAVDDFTTVTNRLDQALSSCADNAWTRVSHVFDPSGYANIANGLEVVLRVPSGSLISGDTVRVAQFDLRPGSALAAYVPADPDAELLRCQRRYTKTFPQATAVAQNSGVTNGALEYVAPVTASPFAVHWRFPVVMQKTPTITTYNPAAANDKWRNHTDAADSATPTVVNTSDGSTFVYNGAVAGDTAGDRVYVHATANAEF